MIKEIIQDETKIPHVIHYVWFGRGKHSKLQKKCMKSWRKYCPDYEIKRWDEDSFDLSSAPKYVQQAYEAKKWAFVSDYVRLRVLYEYGGLYFDTDVEVLKDIAHLVENNAFMAFEYRQTVNTAILGCCKGNKLLYEVLQYYETLEFNDKIATGRYVTEILKQYGLKCNGQKQYIYNWVIYSSNYLYPESNNLGKIPYKEDMCFVHWFEGTWHPKEFQRARRHNKNPFIKFLRKIGVIKLYHKIIGIKE